MVSSQSEDVITGTGPVARGGSGRARQRQLGGKAPSRFWRIRESIPLRLELSLMVLSLVLPVAAWWGLELSGRVRDAFLPSPLETAQTGWDLIASGDLGVATWASVQRVALGFGIGMLIAIPLGLGMGTFRTVNALFEPAIAFVRYMPASGFIPLFIMWLGFGEEPKVALLVMGTVFFNTIMISNLVWQVPSELIRVALTLGAGNTTVFRKVILPYALPGIIDTARVNLAAAWNLIVVAELLAAQEGLGVSIIRAQRFLRTDDIFVALIVIGLIGVTTDILLRLLRNRVAGWSQEPLR